MQIDFHYHLIYVLAEQAGFNRDSGNGEMEAGIIAYASQYVDDNNDNQVIGAEEEPSYIKGDSDGSPRMVKTVFASIGYVGIVRSL